MTRVASLCATLLLTMTIASAAQAQTPLGIATQTQASGFKLGENTIAHVYGNVDVRFDSNPMLLNQQPAGDLLLRFRVGGNLARPSDRLELRLSLSFDYTQYLGVTNPATRKLSAPQGQLDFGLIANRDGRITFFFNDTFNRTDTAANISLTERLRWIRNFAQIGTDIRPAGGRALEFRVSYGLDFVLYDFNQFSVEDPASLSFLTHLATLNATWRFFPKTAFIGEAQGAFTMYPFPSLTPNPNINGLRISAGIMGQVTPKLTVLGKVGYGNTFLVLAGAPTPLQNFNSAIALAQVTFRPFETTTLIGGYSRDFAPTAIFGFVSIDRPFLEFRQLIAGRFILDLKAQYMFQNFGTPAIAGVTARSDHVITGEARFSVQGKAWFAGGVYYIPEIRITTFTSPNGTPAAYQRHVAGIDATFGW
jgi:hypothetical protein